MNFFGHAVMACFASDTPAFVLGAMLPDLTSMAGLRLARVRDPELAAGVDHHHQVDHAFHSCEPFVALCSSALATLEERGVARAAARAVGHVGSELLIDGALSSRAAALDAYARALQFAIEDQREDAIELREGDRGHEMRALLRQLAAAPIPIGYRDPRFVHERLERILARRPRLALRPSERAPVLQWIEHAHARIDRDASEIVDRLRRQLS